MVERGREIAGQRERIITRERQRGRATDIFSVRERDRDRGEERQIDLV